MSKEKSLKVYTIVEMGPDRKNLWFEIGRAFENKDGSTNVVLNALPVDGKLQIRETQGEKPQ